MCVCGHELFSGVELCERDEGSEKHSKVSISVSFTEHLFTDAHCSPPDVSDESWSLVDLHLLWSSSWHQFFHQGLHGREETRLELLVRESSNRLAGSSSDLQSSWRRQCQDGFHGSSVAVLAVCQEARLPALVRHHDVQLRPSWLVGKNDGACSHALHHTCTIKPLDECLNQIQVDRRQLSVFRGLWSRKHRSFQYFFVLSQQKAEILTQT